MDFKKWKMISPIIIFILCSITHFGYQLIPNIITSFFFPVNESVFEHMKMIYTSVLIFSLIEYFVIRKNNWILNNLGINPLISGVTNIFSFLIIYLPIRMILEENMIITFIILFISNIIAAFVSYHLLKNKQIINDKLGLILTLLMYIPFIYLTYNPIHISFFYDSDNELYGIPKH
ncbi:MAG: hypothetical protein IJ565_06680 [Bacilli bacterium]|nr:hypothetical protein [Bacilli bacterium]